MGSSQLKLGRTTTMKFLVAIALAAVGVAAEPGFYRGYAGYYGGHRGYGGYHHIGKRSADAEAVATADADAEPDSMEDTMVDILVDTMAMEAMCITLARGLLTLTLDSIEDMLDIMEATVAMVDTITSARGLLMPRLYPQLMLSLDSMEDTMVVILVDTMARWLWRLC